MTLFPWRRKVEGQIEELTKDTMCHKCCVSNLGDRLKRIEDLIDRNTETVSAGTVSCCDKKKADS